jgi:phage tail protein X
MLSYTTISGDTWDIISYKIYGSCMYMALLMDENEKYAETVIFPAGIVIKAPEIEVSTEMADTLPPWKL